FVESCYPAGKGGGSFFLTNGRGPKRKKVAPLPLDIRKGFSKKAKDSYFPSRDLDSRSLASRLVEEAFIVLTFLLSANRTEMTRSDRWLNLRPTFA
ncbi:unnamed protein product, partial [Dovyalis caffra]